MKAIVCPHCGAQRVVVPKIPKDVVVVLPCAECHELILLFRKKVVALSRKTLEHGTFEERKAHIAEIITEFLDPDMFSEAFLGYSPEDEENPEEGATAMEDEETPQQEPGGGRRPMFRDMPARRSKGAKPISQNDVEHFVKIDLKRIDETSYFREHFG